MLQSQDLCVKPVVSPAHTDIEQRWITETMLSLLARTCYLVLWTRSVSSYVTRWYVRDSGDKYSALACCQLQLSLHRQRPTSATGAHNKTDRESCYMLLHLTFHASFTCLPSHVELYLPQKKLPLTSLSQAMQEGGGQLGDESLIGWDMELKYNFQTHSWVPVSEKHCIDPN